MSSENKRGIGKLPLSDFPVLFTSDLDHLRSIVSSNFHPVQLEVPHNRQTFKVQYNHLFLGGISISAHQNTSHFRSESGATENSYVLQFLPLRGEASVEYKNEKLFLSENVGTIISPFGHCADDYYDNQAQVVLRIERRELEACFETLTGRHLPQPLEFDFKIDLRNAKLASLRSYMKFIIKQLDMSDSMVRMPLIQTQLTDALLIGLLTLQPHNLQPMLERADANSGPAYVRRAEEFIRENILNHVSVVQTARAVGVSLRSLQMGFKKYRGYSMRDFIKEERLKRARHFLKHPQGRNIYQIALDCGINNPSQFSAYYKQRFGETPSQTLARFQHI